MYTGVYANEHMNAVTQLSTMMDDSTLYIIQMPQDIALVLGSHSMAQDNFHIEETTVRLRVTQGF